MAQPLPISSFERLSATEDWEDFKREALLIAKTQPALWDAIADLADDMLDGGREAVAEIQRIAEAEPTPAPRGFVRRIGKREDFKAMLAGAVSKLHQLQPDALDQLIKQGEADPEINVEEEEEPAAAVVNLPALIPLRQPATWDDALDAINQQHAIIENVGGKTVIASWEPSPINPKRKMIVFQTKESFILRYSNRSVLVERSGKRGTHFDRVPLAEWWLTNLRRAQYRGVIFHPGGPRVIRNCLKLWQGWGVDPEPGDWSLIRNHIEEVIADGNREFADYVIRWIAWAIQNPAAQAEVALVLIGFKGVGKGTLVRCLQRIFGAHAFQVTSREEVIGKFNGHLQDCILFVADEAYWGGDKRCVGRLQGMLTEPYLPIERKGFDLIQVPNYLHTLLLAEPGWVIPAGRYERRYAALTASDRRREDREYFRALHRQIAEGGAEAMMWDLQRMPLDGWHPREIPESLLRSSALQRQQAHTLPPLEQWYLSLLQDGRLPKALINNNPNSKKLSRPNTAYTRSLCEDACERFPRLRFELSDVMLEDFVTDEGWPKAKKFRDSKRNGWTFEPLTDSRQAWDKRYGPQAWSTAKDWGDGNCGGVEWCGG